MKTALEMSALLLNLSLSEVQIVAGSVPTALCKGEGAINTFFMFMGMGIISNKEVPLPDELC